MGTAIGFECDGGAVLAADRLFVRSGSVESRTLEKLFTFETIGTAAIGGRDGIDTFEREFDAELRSYRTERGEPTLDAVARIVSRIAEGADVDVLLVARDGDGRARLRTVDADGSVLEEAYDAIGSGAQLAIGQLETIDRDVALSEAATTAESVIETVSERDSDTGDDVDVWQLAHDSDA